MAPKKKKLLRPNPHFDEDLENATVVGPSMTERILSYNKKDVKKRVRVPCKYTDVKHKTRVPMLTLNDGNEMPGFGIGMWLGFNNSGGRVTADSEVIERALRWAVKAGYRHIDTAHIYETEVEVGRAVNNLINDGTVKREELFITTKLWNDSHARWAVVPALQESLHKLNLDYVDLYLIHWPIGQKDDGSYDNTDYLETWQGMVDARDMGLAKSIGLSNFNQQMLDRIISLSPVKPAVLQVEINLNLQQPELLKYCCEQNIQVVAYTPLGSLLYHRAARAAPRPRIDNMDLEYIANKYNKTVPEVVLRYLLELGVTPIPKSVTKNHIFENIDVFDFQLTQQEKDFLRRYDKNYRTIGVLQWEDHIYYPFEKHTKSK